MKIFNWSVCSGATSQQPIFAARVVFFFFFFLFCNSLLSLSSSPILHQLTLLRRWLSNEKGRWSWKLSSPNNHTQWVVCSKYKKSNLKAVIGTLTSVSGYMNRLLMRTQGDRFKMKLTKEEECCHAVNGGSWIFRVFVHGGGVRWLMWLGFHSQPLLSRLRSLTYPWSW